MLLNYCYSIIKLECCFLSMSSFSRLNTNVHTCHTRVCWIQQDNPKAKKTLPALRSVSEASIFLNRLSFYKIQFLSPLMPLLYYPGMVCSQPCSGGLVPLNVCFIRADVVGDVRCHLAQCLFLTEANMQRLMQGQVIDRVVHLWRVKLFLAKKKLWAYVIKYLSYEVFLSVVGHSMQVWGG